VYPEPHAVTRRPCPEGASPEQRGDAHYRPHPEERYHFEYVQVSAEEDAELVLLRGAIYEGSSRGWKLMSAIKEPGGAVLLLTWDNSGSFSR
jgi:hypothetical protein